MRVRATQRNLNPAIWRTRPSSEQLLLLRTWRKFEWDLSAFMNYWFSWPLNSFNSWKRRHRWWRLGRQTNASSKPEANAGTPWIKKPFESQQSPPGGEGTTAVIKPPPALPYSLNITFRPPALKPLFHRSARSNLQLGIQIGIRGHHMFVLLLARDLNECLLGFPELLLELVDHWGILALDEAVQVVPGVTTAMTEGSFVLPRN